ncbi:hypothetical protein EMIT074MI3_12549 [Bacillus licheniformis]
MAKRRPGMSRHWKDYYTMLLSRWKANDLLGQITLVNFR